MNPSLLPPPPAVAHSVVVAVLIALLALVTFVAVALLRRVRAQPAPGVTEPWRRVREAAAGGRGGGDHSSAAEAICDAARSVCGADAAQIWRLADDGDLLVTESCGAAPRTSRLVLPDDVRRQLVEERIAPAALAAAVRAEAMAATTALRAEVEAMTVNGAIIGFLSVTWTQYGLPPSPEAHSVLSLLAAHAAMLAERDELQRFARQDPLTSLPNRRAFDDALRREIGRATRYRSPLAVAVLDLDDLKRVNDTEGHQAGDDALRAATEAWRPQLRDIDLLARVGGDEFGLVLPDCDLDRGREVVERLRLATPRPLSCSIGLTRWAANEKPDDVLQRADDALYESKRAGRNRSTALDAPSNDGDPAVAPR